MAKVKMTANHLLYYQAMMPPVMPEEHFEIEEEEANQLPRGAARPYGTPSLLSKFETVVRGKRALDAIESLPETPPAIGAETLPVALASGPMFDTSPRSLPSLKAPVLAAAAPQTPSPPARPDGNAPALGETRASKWNPVSRLRGIPKGGRS